MKLAALFIALIVLAIAWEHRILPWLQRLIETRLFTEAKKGPFTIEPGDDLVKANQKQ